MTTITFECSCGRTFQSRAEVNNHAAKKNAARRPGEPRHEGAMILGLADDARGNRIGSDSIRRP